MHRKGISGHTTLMSVVETDGTKYKIKVKKKRPKMAQIFSLQINSILF